MERVTRILGPGEREFSSPGRLPGWRMYVADSASGVFSITNTTTDGALVLWNPDGYVEGRREPLPQGTHAAHMLRAHAIARALDDGAYLAVDKLAKVFYLESGERDAHYYHKLRRAHDVAQPTYHEVRNYLANEENIPYPIACIVAARSTSDGQAMFRTLVLF